jgi:tetratricopeptide (TPR) repeat protein
MATEDEHLNAVIAAEGRIRECSAFLSSGDAQRALSGFEALLEEHGQSSVPEIRRQARRALVGRGASLLQLGRLADAQVAFLEAQSGAKDAPDPSAALATTRRTIVRLLLRRERTLLREDRHKQAIEVADCLLSSYAAELPSEHLELVIEAKMLRCAALAAGGEVNVGVAGLNALVKQYGQVETPAVRKVLANACNRKGDLLAAAGDSTGAIEGHDQALSLIGEGGEEFALVHANALLAKLTILENDERLEDALEVEDDLIVRFDENPPDQRPLVVINARFRKIRLLQRLTRRDEAIAVCDELVEHYGEDADIEIRFKVAVALDDKADLLFEDDRYEATVAVLNEIERRFKDADDDRLQGVLARGLRAKALALQRLGRWESAIAADEQLVEHYGHLHDPEIGTYVAGALCHRAAVLQENKRTDEALACWGDVIVRYRGTDVPATRRLLARAFGGKLELLWLTGQTDEMGPLAQQMIDEVRPDDDDGQLQLARALSFQVAMLGDTQRYEETIDAADAMVTRFPDPTDPGLQRQIAQTLVNKVLALGELGRHEEAEATQQDILARFGEEALEIFTEHAGHAEEVDGPRAEAQRAASLYSRAWFLNGLGRTPEALAVLDGLLDYDAGDNESIAKVIAGAHALREEIQSEQPDG